MSGLPVPTTTIASVTPNSDQTFALIRQVLTAVASYAVGRGWMSNDMTEVLIGIVPVLINVGLSLWTNAGNSADMVFGALRQILTAVGGFAVARGWITTEQVQQILGVVMVLVSSALSLWFYRKAPGPNLPGTTLLDATATKPAVIAGTAEGTVAIEKSDAGTLPPPPATIPAAKPPGT